MEKKESNILFLFSHTEPDYPESDLDDTENTDPSEEAQNPSWKTVTGWQYQISYSD